MIILLILFGFLIGFFFSPNRFCEPPVEQIRILNETTITSLPPFEPITCPPPEFTKLLCPVCDDYPPINPAVVNGVLNSRRFANEDRCDKMCLFVSIFSHKFRYFENYSYCLKF